jgi:hypothetical protein
MMKIIEIPLQTISELNVREHWRVGHLRHKGQKFLVKTYLTNYNVPRMVPVIVTMVRIGKKKLDSDNLQGAFKYVRDAVADYFFPGLAAGRADENEEMHWRYDQEIGNPGTKLILDWDLNEHPWMALKEGRLEGNEGCPYCEEWSSGMDEILPTDQ